MKIIILYKNIDIVKNYLFIRFVFFYETKRYLFRCLVFILHMIYNIFISLSKQIIVKYQNYFCNNLKLLVFAHICLTLYLTPHIVFSQVLREYFSSCIFLRYKMIKNENFPIYIIIVVLLQQFQRFKIETNKYNINY